jgi:hypothetical protein
MLMGVWIVFGMAVWHYRKKLINYGQTSRNLQRIEGREFLFYFFYALGLYAYLYFLNVASVYGEMRGTHKDAVFYAGVVSNLNRLGIETTLLEPSVFTHNEPARFYHYFELWFAAGVSRFFHTTGLYALVLVANVTTLALAAMGGLAIATRMIGKRTVAWFLGIALLFINSYQLLPGGKELSVLSYSVMQLTLGIKMSIVLVLLIWFWMVRSSGDMMARMIPIALVCIIYPTVFPVVGVSAFVTLAIVSLLDKQVTGKEMRSSWAMIVLVWAFVFLFYACNKGERDVASSSGGAATGLIAGYLASYGVVGMLCSSGGHLIKGVLSFLLHVLPVALLTWFVWRRKKPAWGLTHTRDSIWIASMFVVGFGGECLFYRVIDYSQIMINILAPLTLLLTFWIVCAFLSDRSHKTAWIVAFLCFVIPWTTSARNRTTLVSLVSHNRQEEAADSNDYRTLAAVVGSREVKIAYVMDKSVYAQKSPFQKNIFTKIPFPDCRRFSDTYFPVCLSAFDIPSSGPFEEKWQLDRRNRKSAFYRYVTRKRMTEQIQEAKIDFLKDFSFDYLFVPREDTTWEQFRGLRVARVIQFNTGLYKLLELRKGE